MTDLTRAELSERLASFHHYMIGPDGESIFTLAAAALHEPAIRWGTADGVPTLFLGDALRVGEVELWNHPPMPDKPWRACAGAWLSWHATDAEARAALEAHVAAQLGGTPADKPVMVTLEEAGIHQFTTRDTAYVVDGIESDPYQLLHDMETREIVGVQWPIAPDHSALVQELVDAVKLARDGYANLLELGYCGEKETRIFEGFNTSLARAREAGFPTPATPSPAG